MQQQKIEAIIEAICNKGCQAVRNDIRLLEQDQEVNEARHLTAQERQHLLTELLEIMAVYGDSCRLPGS